MKDYIEDEDIKQDWKVFYEGRKRVSIENYFILTALYVIVNLLWVAIKELRYIGDRCRDLTHK